MASCWTRRGGRRGGTCSPATSCACSRRWFLSLSFFPFFLLSGPIRCAPIGCLLYASPTKPQCYYRPRRSRPIVTHLPGISYAIWTTFPYPFPTGTLFVLAVLSQVLYIDGLSTHIPWSVRVLCLTSRLFLKSFSHRASVVPGLLTSVFLLAGTDGPYTFSPAPTVFYA